MSVGHPCAVRKRQAKHLPTGGDYVHIHCPRCGKFRLTGRGGAVVQNLSVGDRFKLSGWVRGRNMLGEVPKLNANQIDSIILQPIPGLVERADRLLMFATRALRSLGQLVDMNDPAFEAATYSNDRSEVVYLARFLEQQGFIEINPRGDTRNAITPQGYVRCEKLRGHLAASTQGFVAMWFDDGMREAYEGGFEVGIREAGYDPLRIDRVEHIRKIDDEIIARIRRSRFVVADFTGHRGGVYFEAGFALGLNIPVFWTCREDAIHALHFDIRQFNTITWTKSELSELAKRLGHRIEAVIGRGPRSPVSS